MYTVKVYKERRFIMRKIGLILVSIIASLEIGCSIYAADADIQYNEVIDEKENEEENIIEKGYDPAINANAYYERSTVKKMAGIQKVKYGIIIMKMVNEKQVG